MNYIELEKLVQLYLDNFKDKGRYEEVPSYKEAADYELDAFLDWSKKKILEQDPTYIGD